MTRLYLDKKRVASNMIRIALIIVSFSFSISSALAQNTTLSNIAGEAASVMGGETDIPVLGFNVQKTSGSPDINGVTITFTSNPVGIFFNMKLFKSADASHGPADVELGDFTLVSGNTYTVSFTAETIPAGSSLNFYVAVDIDRDILASTSIGATISNTQLSLVSGTAVGLAAGPVYTGASITELTAAIGSLNAGANNVAAAPLISGSVAKGIFGFSLNSNGDQTLSELHIQFTEDPAVTYTGYSLVRSADTDFATGNTTIGGLTFTPSATELLITGLSEDISSTVNYFLVATVLSSVNNTTDPVQASLSPADVTTDGGYASGSATGVDYSFDALTTTVTQLTGNIAPTPLGNNVTDAAILGFSIASNGTPDLTAIDILTTTNATNKFLAGSARLFESADASFGGDAEIVDAGGYTVTFLGDRIQITNLAQSLSTTTQNFFLVIDVDPAIDLSATPSIQPSFATANITISGGGAVTLMPASPITGLNYTFVDSAPPDATFSTVGSSPNVSVLGNITINLDEAILKTDGSPVIDADLIAPLITLKTPNAGGSAVAFTATINAGKTQITIDPTATLLAGTAYYVSIGPVEDAIGNESILQSATFTTESAPTITNFTPSSTCVGESVVITGTRFGTNPGIDPIVTVNGVPATVTLHSNTSITFTVPNTTSGNIEVTNAENTLSVTSGSSLTTKPAIDTTVPITVNPAAPAASQNYSVQVGSTQTTVTYRMSEDGGSYNPGGGTAGTGAQISFGPFNHSPGTYSYTIQATSTGCATKIFPAVPFEVTIATLEAHAGGDRSICTGETTILGDAPAGTGGTGFLKYQWTGPSGFTSTLPNPEATVAGTYTLTVTDNSGNTDDETVDVTVNTRTPPSELAITLDPNDNGGVYSNKDEPIALTFVYSGPLAAGTGIFSGTGVNTTSNPDRFYPSAANIGFSNITLNYTNANGCLTTKDVLVNVFDNSSNFTGFETKYCYLNIEDPVTPSLASYALDAIKVWHYNYTTFSYTTDEVGITFSGGGYTFNPQAAANGYVSADFGYAFIYLEAQFHLIADPAQTTSVYKYTQVYPLPEVKVKQFDEDEICKNGGLVKLAGFPVGGVWSGPGSAQFPGNDMDPEATVGEDGLGIFNPNTANIGNNTAVYTFRDRNGCESTASDAIIVKDIPAINFTFQNKCVGEVVNFRPTQTLPAGVTITEYFWTFGDDNTLAQTSFTDPTEKIYTNASEPDVTLQVTASNGCIVSSPSKEIVIGEVPTVDFSWENVCQGAPTTFQATVNDLGTSTIQSITWDLNGTGYGASGGAGDFATSTNSYTPGSRNAKVRVITSKGCVAEKEQFVYTVPSKTAAQLPYRETFDATDGQWVTGITNAVPSSWAWGAPAKAVMNADESGSGKAWITSLAGTYNQNEQSWVHSPCFDLSEIDRPILQVDIRSLTPDGIDGAVLQYNSKGTTENEQDWKNVGVVNQGDNWFTQLGILSNPGNQAVNQAGWTGVIDPWTNGKYPLDGVIASIPAAERKNVRFRLAFASSNFIPSREGFAFDNFDIHQRDRIVLLETFTNNGGENENDEPNKVYNQVVNTFVNNRPGEIIKLEYHVGLGGPGEDAIYQSSQVDANARAAFYGVASAPTGFIDAILPNNNFNAVFDERTLKGAMARIDTIYTVPNPAGMFNVYVKFTPLQPLPANTVLHIAVIEKEIEDVADNGETSFHYVMRKMVPDATGTRYPDGLPINVPVEETYSSTPNVFDINELAIVAFIQNETTHEVYQARYLGNPVLPSIITDAEPSLTSRVNVYPNPSDRTMSLELPAKTRETIRINLLDNFGRAVITDGFARGESFKLFNTEELAAGMYILRLETDNEIIHKKVMIVHK